MLHERDRDTHYLTQKASVTLTISFFFFPIIQEKYSFSESPYLSDYTVEDSKEPLPVLHYLQRALFLRRKE